VTPVKCVVWDLDHTVWDGVLLEDGAVPLRPGVVEASETLDRRGVLQSVASKNEHEAAWARLTALGLDRYFIYPQIGWGSKVGSIESIASSINIGLDTIAFVDDQPFERDEVQHSLPLVRTYCATQVDTLADRPEMTPRFITDDSSRRREMYQADIHRQGLEDRFDGPKEAFLETLDLRMKIASAADDDLARAEELTVRTNQLNATGRTYDYDELAAFRASDDHLLLIAELEDRYGTYGKIGLALVELGQPCWAVRLLLMSCRVMSRGVGSVLMNDVMRRAQAAGRRLQADFVETPRNRMMLVTYRFAGFREVSREGDHIVFEHDLAKVPAVPAYMELTSE